MAGNQLPSPNYRLGVTRRALGLSQAEICRRLDLPYNIWNNAETGDNGVTTKIKAKMRDAFGIGGDWFDFADQRAVPSSELMAKIAALMVQDASGVKPAKKARKSQPRPKTRG